MVVVVVRDLDLAAIHLEEVAVHLLILLLAVRDPDPARVQGHDLDHDHDHDQHPNKSIEFWIGLARLHALADISHQL